MTKVLLEKRRLVKGICFEKLALFVLVLYAVRYGLVKPLRSGIGKCEYAGLGRLPLSGHRIVVVRMVWDHVV